MDECIKAFDGYIEMTLKNGRAHVVGKKMNNEKNGFRRNRFRRHRCRRSPSSSFEILMNR